MVDCAKTETEFEHWLSQILNNEIPEEFSRRIENVVFMVEKAPTSSMAKGLKIKSTTNLLGLYQGLPLPDRSVFYSGTFPDQIILFEDNIRSYAKGARRKAREVLKETLIHELGHYFGFSDAEMRRLGI